MRLMEIYQRSDVYSFKVYPSFVDVSIESRFNGASIGKIKNQLVKVVKNNFDQTIQNLIKSQQIEPNELSRLILYPVGVAEYWKAPEKLGSAFVMNYLGLFLNKQGVSNIERVFNSNSNFDSFINFRTDLLIKPISSSFGDIT